MVSILDRKEKVLRQKAKEIALKDISSKKIQKIISDMKEALASQDDGVAIAAPQIGVSLRIFVVSGRVMSFMKGSREDGEQYPDQVFINPKITKLSKEKEVMEEGCLSVRYFYGKVKRSTKTAIEAYDENGNFVKKGGSGLMAQVFQHETDHLDGILFTDSATELEEVPPEVMKSRSHSR